MFEAKTASTDRIKQDAVTDTQWEALEYHSLMGARTFVFVSFGLREFYRIPWCVWCGMKELYGRKYITQADICKYKLNEKNGIIFLFEGI